jgi:hypothetical protein
MQNPKAKEERLSAFAQASQRRLAALREMFGMTFVPSRSDEEKPKEPTTDLSAPHPSWEDWQAAAFRSYLPLQLRRLCFQLFSIQEESGPIDRREPFGEATGALCQFPCGCRLLQ